MYSLKMNRATTHNKKYWRCIYLNLKLCNGSCSSDGNNDNIKLGKPHNHAPSTLNDINQRKQEIMHRMKVRAMQTNCAPSAITREVIGACSDKLMSVLPTKDSCRRLVAKKRPTPNAPKDIHFDVSYLFFVVLIFFLLQFDLAVGFFIFTMHNIQQLKLLMCLFCLWVWVYLFFQWLFKLV